MNNEEIPSDIDRNALAKERTILATERNRLSILRTYFAGLRTGLAITGAGIALMRLLPFYHLKHKVVAQVFGSILVVVGITIFIFSFEEYRQYYKKLKLTYEFRFSLIIMSLIASVLTVVSIGLLVITYLEIARIL